MKSSLFWRVCAAGVATAAVALSSLGAATAAPVTPSILTPDRGPDIGGTEVSVELPDVQSWIAVEPGRSHVLGLADNGLLYTWSEDGAGAIEQVPTPEGVTFSDISVGTVSNLAISNDGRVYTWGGFAPDGTGNIAQDPVAVELPGDLVAEQVSAGRNFALVLTDAGTVYGWGGNSEGVLGIGSGASQYVPVLAQIDPSLEVTQVSAGSEHVLALAVKRDDPDSTPVLLGWGNNSSYALGARDGNARNERLPIELVNTQNTHFTGIASSMGDASGHSLVLDSEGDVWAMGRNNSGQTGTGSVIAEVNGLVIADVNGDAAVAFSEIAAGDEFSAAITSAGSMYTWGNTPAALNTGGTAPVSHPIPSDSPPSVTLRDLRVGVSTITAIGNDGHAYIWGKDPGRSTLGTARQLPAPPALLSGVTFGDAQGTDLRLIGGNTWSIRTPPNSPGFVDVVLDWELAGLPQPAITIADGFMFTSPPTVSSLRDKTTRLGEATAFDLTVAGFPTPTITWEVRFSSPEGANMLLSSRWEPITADASAEVSADGRTLTVIPKEVSTGTHYRAIASNDVGLATTNSVSLTVLEALTEGGVDEEPSANGEQPNTPPKNDSTNPLVGDTTTHEPIRSGDASLANTGSPQVIPALGVVVALLISVGAILVRLFVANQNRQESRISFSDKVRTYRK